MSFTPEISVVIAAYNDERSIIGAIHSALRQDGVTVEVIVVDDCSTDSTYDVANKIDDCRVIVLRHEQNKWVSAARNTGINNAKGKWIAILDSDDEFEPNRLIRLKTLAEMHNCDIVCDNLLLDDVGDTKTHKTMFEFKQLDAIKNMALVDFIEGNLGGDGYAYGNFKPFMNAQFLREHQISYLEHLKWGEDYFILADALAAGATCIVDSQVGYRYRLNTTVKRNRLTASDTQRIFKEGVAFNQRTVFDESVKHVLEKRQAYIQQRYYYLSAVEAIKELSIIRFIKLVIAYPQIIKKLLN